MNRFKEEMETKCNSCPNRIIIKEPDPKWNLPLDHMYFSCSQCVWERRLNKTYNGVAIKEYNSRMEYEKQIGKFV